ncbi:MAG: hypothetical protein WKG32_17780 [Gemmatimonadaceae bacterium]
MRHAQFDPRHWPTRITLVAALLLTVACGMVAGCKARQPAMGMGSPARSDVPDDMALQTLAEGQRIFRFDAFGDEQFWTDTARMHEVVQRSVSPTTALSVGLRAEG